MKFRLALVLFASLAADAASADDGPPAPAPAPRSAARKPIEPRKFENGKLTDPYWGITYQLAGLEEKKVERQAGKLLDGHVGKLQVEVSVSEYVDQLSAKERRDAAKKTWDDKGRVKDDYAQGDDPAPWATFVGEAPSGDKRREGYAWYVRGPRAFVVWARAGVGVEGGAEAVKAALHRLVVGPETGAAVNVQIVSTQTELPYDDPMTLAKAAGLYLPAPDEKNAKALPVIAEDLLHRSLAAVPGTRLEHKAGELIGIHFSLSDAQIRLKKFDEALATLNKCVDLAAKTETPGPSGAKVMYNLACLSSVQGKLDDAFAWLEKAFARAADWGPPVPDVHLRKDPDLENCRKDPRWEKFMRTKPTKQ